MRHRIIEIFLLAVAALVIPCAQVPCANQQQPNEQDSAVLARPVASFKVEGLSMLDALLELGQQERLPLGIEYVDLEQLQKPISVQLDKATVGQTLDAILAHGKGYSYCVRGGVVNITNEKVPAGPQNLLNHVLPRFSIELTPLVSAAYCVQVALDRDMHPPPAGAGRPA